MITMEINNYSQDIANVFIDESQEIPKNEYLINKQEINLSSSFQKEIAEDSSKIKFDIINLKNNKDQKNRDYSISIQKWIGYVQEINCNSFIAVLNDLTNPTTKEIAEFNTIKDISKEDIPLVKIGSIFYWSIAYYTQNGQRKKESFIRFKRSIPFSESDIDEIVDKADKLNKNIHWE